MRKSNSILLIIFILITISANAQNWHKIYEPMEDLEFCEIFENADNTISILTNTSFSQHRFTILNEEGWFIHFH